MSKNEFYIGWQEDAPSSFRKTASSFFIYSILSIVVFIGLYSFSQKGFIESTFEYGKMTKLQGTLVDYPVYGIRTTWKERELTVPLVGFGKFGAKREIDIFLSQNSTSEKDLVIEVTGTMIYYQDKAWMELTNGSGGIKLISKENHKETPITSLGYQIIEGEIVDPKCFFGVMNPAVDKIHRSCAIRCISGGIPPIFAIQSNEVYQDYYFVTDENGEPMNQEILQYVGYPISLYGEVEEVEDWKILKIKRNLISQSAQWKPDLLLARCQ